MRYAQYRCYLPGAILLLTLNWARPSVGADDYRNSNLAIRLPNKAVPADLGGTFLMWNGSGHHAYSNSEGIFTAQSLALEDIHLRPGSVVQVFFVFERSGRSVGVGEFTIQGRMRNGEGCLDSILIPRMPVDPTVSHIWKELGIALGFAILVLPIGWWLDTLIRARRAQKNAD